MKRETLFWIVIMVLGAAGLIYQTAFSRLGMAKQYVQPAPTIEGQAPPARVRYVAATYKDFAEKKPGVRLSLPRTIGVWVSAFFTLAIFSFLYRDNPFYKLTEAIFIGISAAYWMIIGFWSTIIPNLVAKLWPDFARAYFMPDLNVQPEAFHHLHYVPLVLALMLFCRLIPGIGWISRWPLAFVVGTTAGLKLLGFLQADFLQQIVNTMMPLVVIKDNATVGQTIWDSAKNIVTVIGVVSGLVYFLFTVEHRGPVEKIAKVGVWVMMITFGAAFGYTVMGRIALLAARLEFLFDDWLWIIDPLSKRVTGS